jgi:hypothetical protein
MDAPCGRGGRSLLVPADHPDTKKVFATNSFDRADLSTEAI